jgi:hypothetical protein
MSRGEGAIRGKFRGILRGFNIRWATRLLRETPRADLFSVRAQRSSVGLLGQRQFFSPRKRRWAGARGRKTAAGRTAVRPYIPLPLCGKGGTRNRANRRAPLHPAATLWERGNAQSGEPPCAPTSRCHSVGEGERAIGRTAVRPYTPLPQAGEGLGVRAIQNAHPPHAANSTDVPLSYQSPSRSSQKTAVDNPLLKVPPAGRGNRTAARFPSRSGGNLQEGGNRPLPPPTGSRCRQGEPNPCAVPLAKRGEPHGRGQLCPLSPPPRRS